MHAFAANLQLRRLTHGECATVARQGLGKLKTGGQSIVLVVQVHGEFRQVFIVRFSPAKAGQAQLITLPSIRQLLSSSCRMTPVAMATST
jgi:hypothetical protein